MCLGCHSISLIHQENLAMDQQPTALGVSDMQADSPYLGANFWGREASGEA